MSVTMRKSANIASVPDIGDVMLAFTTGQSVFAALSNRQQGGATVSAAAVVPYTPITSPLITRKASGVFLVFASVTISVDGGASLVDGDNVTFNLTRVTPGAVALAPIWVTAASTAAGAAGARLVCAQLTGAFIDPSGIAQGATASYGLTVTNTNTHTSGVVAAQDGNIFVLELPG